MSSDKNILSIDFDDDNEQYEAFSQALTKDSERKKNSIAIEFNKKGEQLLKEIDRKKKNQTIKSKKLIKYILKYCNDKYNYEELNSYSYQDIYDIYIEIKEKRKTLIIRFFRFIFNL